MKVVQLTITDEVHARLREHAWRRRMTQADTVRALLDEHLPKIDSKEEDDQPAAEVANG